MRHIEFRLFFVHRAEGEDHCSFENIKRWENVCVVFRDVVDEFFSFLDIVYSWLKVDAVLVPRHVSATLVAHHISHVDLKLE